MGNVKGAITLLLTALFCTGCANYAGLHPNAQITNFCSMNTNPSCHWVNTPWWEMFHDPQLNCLIKQGLCNSPTMKIAQARLRLAQSMTSEASANLWPNIVGRGIIDREHFSKNWLIPPEVEGRTFNQGYLGLKFDYEFDFWGAHSNALSAALSEKQAACADLYSARLILATAIANTYFELRSNQMQRSIAKLQLKQQQTILNIEGKRAAVGIQSAIPTNTASVNSNTAQVNLESLQQATELASHQLNALLGKPPYEPTVVATKQSYHPNLCAIPKTIPLNLIARRPDVMMLRWQIEAAGYKLSVAKAGFYPNINLFALAGLLSIGLENLFKSTSGEDSIGPAFSLPIFDAGRLRANLSEKYADYDRMVEEYNQAILTALREAADQLSILKTTASQEKTQSASLKLKEHNYDLVYQQYHSGIIDYLSTIRAKQVVLEQRLTQVQAQTRYLQSIIAAVKSLGGGYQKDDCGNAA
jgi:NodT family efflux transporter outer membrane factor (OMF) lipoprotein